MWSGRPGTGVRVDPTDMKAITYARYGPPEVLHLAALNPPVPKDDEVLIRTRAAALNALDWHFMRGEPFFIRLMIGGLLKPKDISSVQSKGWVSTLIKAGRKLKDYL